MCEEERKKLLSLLGFAAKARKAVTGTDQVVEAVRRQDKSDGNPKSGRNFGIVLIAADASANTVKRLTNACSYHKIRCERTDAVMSELSHILGKSGDVAAVGMFDRSFAGAVTALLDRRNETADHTLQRVQDHKL